MEQKSFGLKVIQYFMIINVCGLCLSINLLVSVLIRSLSLDVIVSFISELLLRI